MRKPPIPDFTTPKGCWRSTSVRGRRVGRWVFLQLGVVLLLLAACASKTAPPPAVTTPQLADLMYPAVPAALQNTGAAPLIDLGWRYLQSGDLGDAEKEFATALKRNDTFHPAYAGQGDVALARRNFDK